MKPDSSADPTGPGRHLFLSPHYDDIALSCGGMAALTARAGRIAEVALIFGSEPDSARPLTAFAESLHRQWGMDAESVIAGRRAEESAAGLVLGTSERFLPFHDAIYRGARYTSDPLLFGAPSSDEEGLPAAIIDALDLPKTPLASIRIYAPLAIGRHVDHQHAYRVGVTLDRAGWDVWFYEDLPYGLKKGAREERFGEIAESLVVAAVVDVSPTWKEKISAIMAYPSQLAVIFAYVEAGSSRREINAVMVRYAEEVGGGVARAERFWRLAPS